MPRPSDQKEKDHNQEVTFIAAVPPVPAVQECHETVSQSLGPNRLPTATEQAVEVCRHCGGSGGDIVEVWVSGGPADGATVHRECIKGWDQRHTKANHRHVSDLPDPAAAAPVVDHDPPPSPWSNDAVAWQRWFDRHPEELKKFLHDHGGTVEPETREMHWPVKGAS